MNILCVPAKLIIYINIYIKHIPAAYLNDQELIDIFVKCIDLVKMISELMIALLGF